MSEEEIISITDSESSRNSMLLQLSASRLDLQHVYNKPSLENKNNVITISSHSNPSTERCPVTWNNTGKKNHLKYLGSESFLSPSPRTKVSSWLYGNCPNNSDVAIAQNDSKSAILIRQDYRKPAVMISTLSPFSAPVRRKSCGDKSITDGIITITSRGSSVASEIMRNSRKASDDDITIANLDESKTITPNNTNEHAKQTCDTLSDTLSTKVDENKSVNSFTDLEIPNKIELCEYLKLRNMNPADGKVIGSKQNRRSSRVKNLAIMSEKRALERELNSDAHNFEKKKTPNGVDPDVKSCTGSEGSKESRASSKISITTQKTNKKNPPSRKASVEETKIKSTIAVPEDLKNESIQTESLQVPEVSTTSTSKVISEKLIDKEKQNDKSPSRRVNTKTVVGSSPNSERKSVIMTKKSLTQLNININAIKTKKEQERLSNMKHLLLNYVASIDTTDFEDSFNDCISSEDINKHLKNKKQSNNSKNQRSKPLVSKTTEKIKVKQKRKQIVNKRPKRKKIIDKFPKSRLRLLHEKLKMKRALKKQKHNVKTKTIQIKQTFKFYSTRTALTNLRSRGRLKEIGIKSVLLKHDRKKRRRKYPAKAALVTPKRLLEKEFKETVLIQKSLPTAECNEQKKTDILIPPAEVSSLKVFKLKSEIDLLKNLTPEHRKALFESKKFLLTKSKENAKAVLNNDAAVDQGCKDNDTAEKAEKTTETVTNCDTTSTLPKLVNGGQLTQSDLGLSRPTSADLEVHKLMSSSYFKDHVFHKKSKSVEVSSLLKSALGAVLKDKWRCSSSKSTSTTNSSLLTVETEEPVRSLLNEPTQLSSKTDSCENPIIEDIVEGGECVPANLSDEEREENQIEVVDISTIEPPKIDCVKPINQEISLKSLHQCLTQPRRKQREKVNEQWNDKFDNTEPSPKSERKTAQSYAIELTSSNGAVMNAYYLDYNLVIVQERLISFWNQTPLGNVLGAQDMWMPKGDTKRINLGQGCIHKDSSDCIMVLDNSMAYVELWTKEHKSDKRERPVADIFITIYLRLNGSVPVQKVLQLENIHGYANDVQYVVLKNSPYIIVSWNTVNDQLTSTVVHNYQLSSDYQNLVNAVSWQSATHYIASLHIIEDCDTLIMGCGEDKITLWHVDDGYIVATMDLMAIAQQPRTLWAKADRGFIFTLHNFNDGCLHLIATNSFDYSWKQLKVYKQETEYESLLGICIENGLIIAFYDTGILCWSAKSGELIIDSPCENNIFLPFGKHIVVIIDNQVHVRHVLEYLVTIEDS